MVPRLLVVQHEDDCPPAWFGEWAEGSGLELDVRTPYRSNDLPSGVEDVAGLLVMGGEMGAYDDEKCRWLARTRDLIAAAVCAEVPTLGICLGHQLMTVATGGSVVVNPQGRALGVTAVERTEAARHDLLFSVVPDDAVAVQWNNDVAARLPEDGIVLARDPRGDIQAARFGTRAWGVQFHPEVNTKIFQQWVDADPGGKGSPAGRGAPQSADVVSDIRVAESRLEAIWRPFAERFADVVLGLPIPGSAMSTPR
jgi:GMP synthase (glutamine-hydrolysing)